MDDIILGQDFTNNRGIQLSYQPQDILLIADKGRIAQVISNLLSNATKFTKNRTITVTTRIDKDNNQIICSVKDTGSGIDSEILPELFSKVATKSFSLCRSKNECEFITTIITISIQFVNRTHIYPIGPFN